MMETRTSSVSGLWTTTSPHISRPLNVMYTRWPAISRRSDSVWKPGPTSSVARYSRRPPVPSSNRIEYPVSEPSAAVLTAAMMPAHSLPSSPDGAQTRVPMMDRLASRLPAPMINPFLCRIGIANEASSLAVWYDVIDRYR